ncbi:dienelactone hydrolase family protein [Brevundimonas sp.]|uniref:dienelactone hydrolase family protein n=1 Tax=Brevundimonas sp. TaxID=1871086 RepID=UPI002D37A5B2|nr:dienelactone hydrolase family protein [Brevundimonas sp.]HYD27173.1 dienelactone hydrolase family protein [Brevundimonas sp.]
MSPPARFAFMTLIGLVAMLAGGAVVAQTPRVPPRVGVPGCADDVPVRASREPVTFESRGRLIRAHLYTPRGEANGLGVVLLHGGTGFERNSILFDAHAIQLASRGYRVILPAYFDAAEPDRSRPTVTGRAWRQAALDAAGQLTSRGVPAEGVALWGYSRGAGVGLDASTVEGSGVRRAVLVAGAGSVDGTLAGPDLSVLLLHARRDEAVPVRATLRLAGDLRDAGAAVEVGELAFSGHQYDLATWCDVFARTRRFLEGAETGDGPA